MVLDQPLLRLAHRLHVQCPLLLEGQQLEDPLEDILSYGRRNPAGLAPPVDSKCHLGLPAITKRSLGQTDQRLSNNLTEWLHKPNLPVVLEVPAMDILHILKVLAHQEEWVHPHIT